MGVKMWIKPHPLVGKCPKEKLQSDVLHPDRTRILIFADFNVFLVFSFFFRYLERFESQTPSQNSEQVAPG